MTRDLGDATSGGTTLSYRPLYRRVQDRLVERIADGTWPAGQLLPSEAELAGDLGVSAGTVRKALDAMTAENLLLRRQGRGTFVARHDEARVLFRFFKLAHDGEEPTFPESRVLAIRRGPAGEGRAAAALGLRPRAEVIVIERVRRIGEVPCLIEEITLPVRLFPGIESRDPLPNNLYDLFATAFGVTVARAGERLKAIAAGQREADALDIAAGTPLLAIDRIAYGLDREPVEHRLSLCRTDRFHYASDLR